MKLSLQDPDPGMPETGSFPEDASTCVHIETLNRLLYIKFGPLCHLIVFHQFDCPNSEHI